MTPKPPRMEGTIPLPDGRRLGFAEFGVPHGKPILWFHGTPGARRQIPPEARLAALERGVRLIGIDRPGVGDSTAHLYPSFLAWAHDLEAVADRLGLECFGLIGLSGGGPYVLACARALPERVVAGAVLGGVAPTVGPEAAPGGLVRLAAHVEPILKYLHEPLGVLLTALVWGLRPVASPVFNLFMRLSPKGDQAVFARPEMKAMFLDDLLHGSRWGLRAPVYDLVLFGRPWGFYLRDIRVPIRFWHGDVDPLVPLAHGQHQAKLVPNSRLYVRPGESHLGSLASAEEVLDDLLSLWTKRHAAMGPVASAASTSRRGISAVASRLTGPER